MVDRAPEFESSDFKGTTIHIDILVGVTPVVFPAVADKRIEEVLIVPGSIGNDYIEVSFDGGTTYIPLYQFGHIAWSLKNNASGNAIKQIYFKANTDDLRVYGLVNFSEMDT